MIMKENGDILFKNSNGDLLKVEIDQFGKKYVVGSNGKKEFLQRQQEEEF